MKLNFLLEKKYILLLGILIGFFISSLHLKIDDKLIIFIILSLFLFVGMFTGFTLYLYKKIFIGPPFVPSQDLALKTIIEYVEKFNPERVCDLGSGNGKVLLEVAKFCKEAHGYEVLPVLVLLTKIKAKKRGLKNVKVYTKNFWQENLSVYDVITIYGVPYIMPSLEKKLMNEAKKGTIIISNRFTFPNLKHIESKNEVYIYKL